MTQTLSRRDAMIRMGMGTAGLFCLPRDLAASGTDLGDLTELADRIRAAPRDGAFTPATEAIRAGAGYGTLLGAAFVAGIHDVRPRTVGSKLHCVMMVDSAFQLVESAAPREAWLAALWSIEDFKRSQELDRDQGDWVLPRSPEVSFAGAAPARRELLAAMDAWDAERADRAVVGLLPLLDRGALFELLWPYAARSYTDVGHKIIFCAQVERVLRRLGERYVEDAVRSLVNGLLYRRDDLSGSEEAVYERGRELAAKLPAGWLEGREDPAESEILLRRLRGRDPFQAQQLVADAFADGLGPATVWDGLRLYASELLHRRPQSAARRHLCVHPVTEVNAFAYVFRTSRDDFTRRLMILQAAGWLPLLYRDLSRFAGDMEGPGVDVLGDAFAGAEGESAIPSFAEIFAQPSPDAARVRLDRQADGPQAFMAELRSHLVHKAFQSHQYKYAAAIQEESRLVNRRWASRILAPAVTYTPSGVDPDTEIYERSLHALRQAGGA